MVIMGSNENIRHTLMYEGKGIEARAVFLCVQCGNCCKHFDIVPTNEDVERWNEEGRHDIIEWIYYDEGDSQYHDYIFHFVPETGLCPFLSPDNKCKIHETKPKMCLDWPLNKGDKDTIKKCMENAGCLGKLSAHASEKLHRLTNLFEQQISILNKIIDSFDNIDVRLKKVELKHEEEMEASCEAED